jgi:DNA-binding transcriptional LysR family regulator
MSRPIDTLDVDLLRVFSTLMDERSVSRTATRLNRSRYGIDSALQQLRGIFGDPLLLKDRQRMVPTERALHLEASLRRLLGDADAPPLMTAVVDSMRSTAPGMWLSSHRPVARRMRPW